MISQETLYETAIAFVFKYTPANALELWRRAGSATAVWENRKDIRAVVPEASPKLAETVGKLDEFLPLAEREMEFAQAKGIQCLFAEMHNAGTDAVVAQNNMRFKAPLHSDDRFVSRLAMEREGLRYVFYQDIFLLPEDKMIFSSKVDVVCLVNGKLGLCKELDDKVSALEKSL